MRPIVHSTAGGARPLNNEYHSIYVFCRSPEGGGKILPLIVAEYRIFVAFGKESVTFWHRDLNRHAARMHNTKSVSGRIDLVLALKR